MANEQEKVKLSKFLSLVLRHKPETIGLKLTHEGWANTSELIEKMSAQGTKINLETLKNIVETNNKKRFIFNSDQSLIRANQGHSIQIDLGLQPQQPPSILYHGTATRFLDSIMKTGIEKRDRHHVHLSADIDTAKDVGQRHGKPVILEVNAAAMYDDGIHFYISDNNVWLVDHVAPNYLRVATS